MPEETQQEQLVEETTGQEQQPEVMLASEVPAADVLPDDSTERTRKEFEKLTQKNKELSEKLTQYEQAQTRPKTTVLDAYSPVIQSEAPQGGYVPPSVPQQFGNLNQNQIQSIAQSLTDKDGYLDTDVLYRTLQTANETAQQAVERARKSEEELRQVNDRITRFEVTQQAEKLHAVYPELDPSSDVFNEEAFDLVKKELLDQMVKTGKQDSLAAAAKMSKYFRQAPPQPQVVQRQQATVPVATGPRPSQSRDDEFEDLKRRSVRDPNALFERLQRSGY